MNFPWSSLGGFAQTPVLPNAASYLVTPQHFSFNSPMGITAPHTFDAQIVRPVGELPNDEEVLISALCAGRQKGMSVHDSFNEIHTVNGHTAYQWREYYLQHIHSLNQRMESIAAPRSISEEPPGLSKSPSSSPTAAAIPSESESESQSDTGWTHRRVATSKKRRHITPDSDEYPFPLPVPRVIKRSLHLPRKPQYGANLFQPPQSRGLNHAGRPKISFLPTPKPKLLQNTICHAGHIPNAPTEEPTPPKAVLLGARGHKFSEDDTEYMIKSFAYHLNQDATLLRADICSRLAEQAPHHSLASWTNRSLELSIIHNMLRRATGYHIPDSEFDFLLEPTNDEISDSTGRKRRPTQKRPSLETLDRPLKSKPEWTMRNEGPDLESSDEELNEGDHGLVYTMAEQRIMAKHMSTYTVIEWGGGPMTRKLWEPIMHKLPGRTLESVRSRYRLEETRFLLLADRYRKRRRRRLNGMKSPSR